MKAFEGEVTKAQLVASVLAHTEADRIRGGAYWQNGAGCSMGCTLRDFYPGQEGDHSLYPKAFGVPEQIAHLNDAIFEGLSGDQQKGWPLRFVTAIPEGVDLHAVAPEFLARLQERTLGRLSGDGQAAVGPAIEQTIVALRAWRDRLDGYQDLLDAAGYATESAAWSAAGYATESAARYAAWSAALSARSVWSAARYAAWSAARSAEYEWMADTLIELLEGSK